MIYLLAIFLPPLALLLNGQPFAAILNVFLILPCLIFGLVFHPLLLVPSAHAVLAIYMQRENRKHREIVEAIERHGPPRGWRKDYVCDPGQYNPSVGGIIVRPPC